MTICLPKFLIFIFMKNEIWKSVEGYEGLYQVSSYGRVRSLDRMVINSDGVKRLFKGRILKPNKVRNGYLKIQLSKSGKVNGALIHRLVAQSFIQNPDNLPIINHKDENKTDNHVENLEWCDSKYNTNYGTAIQRSAEKRLNSPKLSKPVLQIDKETNEIVDKYPSAMEAARQLKIDQGNISSCCRGELKAYKGFKWQYT